MIHTIAKISLLILFALSIHSCKQGPKVISTPVEGNNSNTSGSTGIFSDADGSIDKINSGKAVTAEVHTVIVNEVLPTDKYVYLNVQEDDESYWIATGKQEVKVGQKYYFKNGILKTNFESKEYNRIFDKVYLVSSIVSADHATDATATVVSEKQKKEAVAIPKKVIVVGSTKISDIIDNPKQYAGQTVQVSGICRKINANIMGRNWIHLKDGSRDDYDFVITANQPIPEGHQVTMTGDVVLDKDFGAGYRYAIIMENGKILNPQ